MLHEACTFRNDQQVTVAQRSAQASMSAHEPQKVSTNPALLSSTFSLFPPSSSRAQQPSEVLVHDERDARPGQDAHQVGAQPSVESAHAFLGKRTPDARPDCGVQMSRGIVLSSSTQRRRVGSAQQEIPTWMRDRTT